ncbi:Ubiquitin domain-containing protein 1 [Gracilariopsis chorda]|uniref:Ubiquitin domain-containing protein 1 n=1 Tax=Gracilariopsis chorda TaxID=448386 RepID=A0A2V3IFT2_9FLOR|nr:Ubiquitin domain-containing protein 1 [Gracilariopsis chorda]|eukprot:PXF40946.1 Ubiquitin domain-containing protein 1 [Gracilariopsis chorda]
MGCASSKQSRRSSERESPQWDGHIRPVRAWKLERPISTEHLARLRNEFWETRVEGRPEMWQALRFAAESQSDELRDETLKAAGMRPANRRYTMQTMFDERGALYAIPMYALVDPTNLDEQPSYEEFKDAARAVADYVEAHDKSRRTPRSL